MSTEPEGKEKRAWKRIILFSSLPIVLLCMYILNELANVEKRIGGAWRVEDIAINGLPARDRFERLNFNIFPNGDISLPNVKGKKPSYPVRYSKCRFKRKNLFNLLLVIDDTEQRFFTGEYEIEILDHRQPQLVKLQSDSIIFYLRELYFSVENTTIFFE